MSLKSILMVASGETDDEATLALAARLAARCKGRLRLLPAFSDPAADLVYYGAGLRRSVETAALERVRAAEREAQAQVEALARDAAARENLAYGKTVLVEQRALQPAVALAHAAVLSDLVVFGAGAIHGGALGGMFAETLLNASTPVYLAKRGQTEIRSVAIAWDGSTRAGSALRAAAPLLSMADDVVVLQNAEHMSAEALAASPPSAVLDYLSLHGIANARHVAARGDHIGASLLATARAEKCDLLVSGAYGRPRLYELVLGGTTRTLVGAENGPDLLLAH